MIVKELAVKFEGNEILSVDDLKMFACYRGLWKTEHEKPNTVRQGIIHSGGCTLSCMKVRINMLRIRMLRTLQMWPLPMHMGTRSLFLSTLKCWTARCPITKQDSETDCYEITFNDYNRVILSTGLKLDASYKISDIS